MEKTTRIKLVVASALVSLFMTTVAAAQTTNTTTWCSEETNNYGWCDKCSWNTAAYSLEVKGYWSDDIRETCDNIGVTFSGGHQYSSYTPANGGVAWCSPGYIITGIDCQGGYCSSVQVSCRNANRYGSNCQWTEWISDDDDTTAYCGSKAYAHGVQCRGDNCAEMQYYCCDYVD